MFHDDVIMIFPCCSHAVALCSNQITHRCKKVNFTVESIKRSDRPDVHSALLHERVTTCFLLLLTGVSVWRRKMLLKSSSAAVKEVCVMKSSSTVLITTSLRYQVRATYLRPFLCVCCFSLAQVFIIVQRKQDRDSQLDLTPLYYMSSLMRNIHSKYSYTVNTGIII